MMSLFQFIFFLEESFSHLCCMCIYVFLSLVFQKYFKSLQTFLFIYFQRKKNTDGFHIPYPRRLITYISGLLITDATFLQRRDCRKQGSRVETAHCYSLYTRASSILARTTHIPHMSLAISVKLTESGAQVVELG